MPYGSHDPGQGQIWLDEVMCWGHEKALSDCSHWGWGLNNCGHNEDVAVHCGPDENFTTNSKIVTFIKSFSHNNNILLLIVLIYVH